MQKSFKPLFRHKVIKKILDYLGIYEFKRDRPPPTRLAAANTFDDYACDDYINYTTGNIVTDFLP